MIRINKDIKRICLLLCVSLLVEIFIFNSAFFFTKNMSETIITEYQVCENLQAMGNGEWLVQGDNKASIEIENIDEKIKYVKLDIVCLDQEGNVIPSVIKLLATDEGNAIYYMLGNIQIVPSVEKGKYRKVHTYGNMHSLKIEINTNNVSHIQIRSIVLNCIIPFGFKLKRLIATFLFLLLVYIVRPSSPIYHWKMGKKLTKGQVIVISVSILLNCFFYTCLIGFNPGMRDMTFSPTHMQYSKLAEALAEGRTNIEVADAEEVSKLSNPYDMELRETVVAHEAVWDVVYYNGKFYVYFGIIPELIFYFPYYLLTGQAFPTWVGIYICSILFVVSIHIFLLQLIRWKFINITIGLYVMLVAVLGSGAGTIVLVLYPAFYNLPVLLAIVFSIFGLSLWIWAARQWEIEMKGQGLRTGVGLSILLGSLFMALVAGCRPQLLLGSFFSIPIFSKFFKSKDDIFKKTNMLRIVRFMTPYIIVAAGLMYYNAIRFGSPFDFGVNYSLTTNDMNLRGVEFDRFKDGIFLYLFQPPHISLKFPFFFPTVFQSAYIGKTIIEYMYGGVFTINIFLLCIFATRHVSGKLREKGLNRIVQWGILSAIVIVASDTQMAGLLYRYAADFLWLFMVSAVIIFLQLWENFSIRKEKRKIKRLQIFLLMSIVWVSIANIFIGIQVGEIQRFSPDMYLRIESWFML